MTTKLIKRTIEETLDAQGAMVEKVIAMEVALLDENGNEVGRVNTNQWGGNFNFNTGNMDVETVSEAVTNILIGQ
jgi:DNA topoisomerase IB